MLQFWHSVHKLYVFFFCLLLLSFSTRLSASQTGSLAPGAMPAPQVMRFYKGNLHTHTNRSDGDYPIEQAVAWYKDHGYDFVAITDHNIALTTVEAESLSTRSDANASMGHSFLVLPGEELSYSVPSDRPQSVFPLSTISIHANTICPTQTAGDAQFTNINDALTAVVARGRSLAPVVMVNHPNYEGALTQENLTHIDGAYLLEIFNGHPHVNNDGGPIWPDYTIRSSTIQIWDGLLSAGHTVYATGTDDTHDFERDPGFTPRRPGVSWVSVYAPALNAVSICAALASGQFYVSQGPELEWLSLGAQNILGLVAKPQHVGENFIIRFTGESGRILSTQVGPFALYDIPPQEPYVRAEIISTVTGKSAWTQAVRPSPVASTVENTIATVTQ